MLLPQLVPASVLKKAGLLGLLAAGQLLVAPKAFATPYCLSPYTEVYSGGAANDIYAVHAPTGALTRLTNTALAASVNSVATDHNNRLVYYAQGTSVYAWDAINNTHITITNNIRSFNSSMPSNATLLSAGGAAFYNGSLYLGVDPPSAGIFEIYKVDFVAGSNGRTIQSVTPLNINGTGRANGALNDGDWGDLIISDNGVIYGSSGGTAKYWSFNLNTNTFTDLIDNIPQSSQLAKDGTGKLWAFRNSTNSVIEIQIVGNSIQTVGTANSTGTHSSADAGECVVGLSSIGDQVWNDLNGNGVQDTAESGIANVTIALYRDINGNGVIDTGEPKLATQTTDTNGKYNFTGLIFGSYIVDVTDTNGVLTGTTRTGGSDPRAVNVSVGIQNIINVDFGYQFRADLSVTKTVSSLMPAVGSNVTFTVTLNNSGPSNATGVSVLDQLPSGYTFVSATPSQGTYNSSTGFWTVGSLNKSSNATLQIVARVNASGVYANTAQVSAANETDPDSTPNNNNASEDDQQSVTITPTSLFGYKSVKLTNDADGSASLTPGDTVTWTVTYINTSSVDIPNFQVTDALSSGVTVAGTPTVIATGLGQVTPTVNNGFNGSSTTSLFTSPVLLKAGGILTVNIPTLLNAATANTIQSNQAAGMGANLPAVGIPTDNIDNTTVNLPVGVTVSLGSISQTQTSNIDPTTVNVGTAPVVSGYKSVRLSNDADSSTTATPGDTLTWTVTYTNTGTVDIPNFQVTDPLPNGMTVAGTSTITALGLGQATPTANSSYNGTDNNTLFNSGVTLKAGGTITISIPVTVNAGSTGTKTNQATGTGSNLPASGVKTDNIDSTTIGLPGGISIAPGSITQAQTASIDPTAVIVNSSLTGLALGFKSVKLTQDLDVSGGPTPGDILTWTISYTNTGTADIKNFQITDSLATGLSAGGTPIIGATGIAQVTPIANSAYDGVGNNALFNTAIDLKAGSTITVNLPVKIDANVAVTTLTNQAVGSGSNLPAVNTDNIDNVTTGLPLGVLVPSGSIVQTQNPGIDPTSLQIGFPISGTLYQDSNGNDSFNSGETTLPVNITVKLLNSTGTTTIATTTTNASGQYSFTGVTNGNYKIQVDTSDTDIPAGLTLGTPNNLAINVSSSPVTGQNFGFDVAAGSCNVGGGTPDAAIAPYISAEVTNNVIATRSLVDTLDDAWRTATGGSSSGTVQPWFGSNSSPGSVNSFRYLDPSTSSNVNATVQLVQVNINGTTTCAGVSSTTSSNPLLGTGASLQDSSPRPASLYSTANQPAFWNQTIVSGNDGRRFAVRFTFDQPVKSFGAWFGDLETRSVNGTPAVLRLLDAFGNRIGNDISIQPTTLYDGTPPDPETINQNQCGNVVGGGFSPTNIGCGNSSTRWVGFVDSSSTPRVSQVKVIVGDDDFNDDGDTEILSFIGANTIPVASNPNLLLVKRITAINGVALNQFVDDPGTNNDNAPNWPLPLDSGSNISTYLRGVVNGGVVRPGDELEYTIYFLSNGNTPVTNVNLCDLVPANSTLIPNSFNSLTPTDGGLPGVDSGIALALGSTTPTAYLTNANDAPDRGQFFAPGTTPSASCSGANTNGAIVVKVVTSPTTLPNAIAPGNPTNSYGFIRFRARVN
jgi:uncharacterized repeat protein (TIGR01451 family)/fimbrial isopeptide formation D2 family protein